MISNVSLRKGCRGRSPSPLEGTTGTEQRYTIDSHHKRHRRPDMCALRARFVGQSGTGFLKSHSFEGELGFKTDNASWLAEVVQHGATVKKKAREWD